jgi:hypothetical protein
VIAWDPTHATSVCDGIAAGDGFTTPVVAEPGGQVVSVAARAWLGMCPARRKKQKIVAAQATTPGHLAVWAHNPNIRKDDISKDGTKTCDRALWGAAAYTHAP